MSPRRLQIFGKRGPFMNLARSDRHAPVPVARNEIALVMLSNFGQSDGGRETWAYNFVPLLLARNPALRLRVYGFRVTGEADNQVALAAAVQASDRERLSVEFVRGPADRVPNGFHFAVGLRRLLLRRPLPDPACVVAVGALFEMAAVLTSGAFRGSTKIFWLRTIFVDEKAHRIPRWARALARRMEDAVLRRADLLIANGDDTAAYYRSRGFDVEVIRNAVDFARWHRPPTDLHRSTLKIAFVGRLARHKGIREFAELAAASKGPGVEFHVVGSGSEEPFVRQAEDRGDLVYHGAMPNSELPRFFETLDACVALTFKSSDGGSGGVSNALLEQMAAGRVIIAWRNEIFEQLLDDSSAYLVAQGSVQGLKEAVSSIMKDRPSARKRAAAAQAIARAHSFDEHVDKFEQLLGRRHLLGATA